MQNGGHTFILGLLLVVFDLLRIWVGSLQTRIRAKLL
jgi:hypothetical protein